MKLTMAEAQAIGLCVLARNSGLPNIHNLRAAVGTLHTFTCGWCEYPTEELVSWLRAFNTSRTRFDDERWDGLPSRVKGEAIRAAQGEAAA